jgi:CubicO group peptidase (beta-lactamase class C family)
MSNLRTYATWTLPLSISLLLIGGFASAKEIPTAKPEAAGMSSAKLQGVSKAMGKLIADQKIAGGIVVVARNGKTVMFNTYGKRDVEANKPMEKDTIVRIYSMSKAIVTAAALMLHDEGKLDPQAPVSKYLPKLKGLKIYHEDGNKAPTREMTVADLMRHTAGVIYGWGGGLVDAEYARVKPLASKNLDQFIDKMSKIPLQYDPGTDWTYSVSIDILGAVIEKASGQPLDQFLAERIFKPLDMKDTGFHVPKDKLDRFAVNYGHTKDGKLKIVDGTTTSKYSRPATFFSGGGGLVSTARDYTRFLMMIQNDGELHGTRLLKKTTVKLMKTNQLPEKAFPIYFGSQKRFGTGFSFGFSVRVKNTKWDSTGRLGEYGWSGAASTHYWVSPADNLIVVTLEQRMPYTFETEFLLKGIIYGAIKKNSGAAKKK